MPHRFPKVARWAAGPPQGQGKQRGLRGANGEDDGPESHGRRPVGNGMGGSLAAGFRAEEQDEWPTPAPA